MLWNITLELLWVVKLVNFGVTNPMNFQSQDEVDALTYVDDNELHNLLMGQLLVLEITDMLTKMEMGN